MAWPSSTCPSSTSSWSRGSFSSWPFSTTSSTGAGGWDSPMTRNVARLIADRKLLVVIVVLIVILSVVDRNFLTLQTLVSLFDHVAINGVMAAGMTILLISGSFDL